MNTTTTTGATRIPGSFETQPIRLRAELPALPRSAYAPAHDFLVPNPRPDLSGATEASAALPAQADFTRRPRLIEPDSIFWSPAAQSSDAA